MDHKDGKSASIMDHTGASVEEVCRAIEGNTTGGNNNNEEIMESPEAVTDRMIAMLMSTCLISENEAREALAQSGGDAEKAKSLLERNHEQMAGIEEDQYDGLIPSAGNNDERHHLISSHSDSSRSTDLVANDASSNANDAGAEEDIKSNILSNINEQMFSLPRPPRRPAQPGAFHPDGRNARDASMVGDDTAVESPEPSLPIEAVLASATPMSDNVSLPVHVLNVDNLSQGEPTAAPSDEDMESGLVNNEGMLSLPRPPQQEHLPGAFYPDGRNAGEVTVIDEDTTMVSSEPSPPIEEEEEDLVSATLVDTEEESRKRQEQVEREVNERVEEEVQEALQQQAAEIERNTEVAEVVTGFWCTPRARRLAALGTFLAIVAIVLGTVLPSVLTPEPTTTPPTPAPTSPLAGLMELLSSVSFDEGVALLTTSTPQNDAVKWLAGDPNLDSYSDAQKIQRHVLATLYYSTNGDLWDENSGWLSDSDECLWYYDNDDDEDTCTNASLMNLTLSYNNLNGTIPQEIALLSNSLVEIDLEENDLTGSMPSEIGLLTGLMYLDLDNNDLTGAIPTEIGLMASLEHLWLHNNSVTGAIPTEIGLMTSLGGLSLSSNNLTGAIPTEIGLLTGLYDKLDLSNNNFSGVIPSEVGLLTWLDELYLLNNSITGKFTCPNSIQECYISCFDQKCEYDLEDCPVPQDRKCEWLGGEYGCDVPQGNNASLCRSL